MRIDEPPTSNSTLSNLKGTLDPRRGLCFVPGCRLQPNGCPIRAPSLLSQSYYSWPPRILEISRPHTPEVEAISYGQRVFIMQKGGGRASFYTYDFPRRSCLTTVHGRIGDRTNDPEDPQYASAVMIHRTSGTAEVYTRTFVPAPREWRENGSV
ncbi:hypothetical protein BJX66DRAFT_241086 [Aspergillus keveii]|uniref:Uncharacterized protein n=1 Tax=Aspergillus keveii TaxID=714993 RepID=A0ABR4GKC7_9EURO